MEPSNQMPSGGAYPVQFDVEYQDRDLDRLTTALRIIVAIPILIVAGAVGGHENSYQAGEHTWVVASGAGGLLVFAPLLMIVFRQKYPRWWFDWNLALTQFGLRVFAYLALLRDEYPSTDAEQAVHCVIPYPDVSQLSRWLPLVKWLLVLPHVVVLALLSVVAIGGVIVAWFAILVTGRYPRSLFDFVVGVARWWLRVEAYALLLTTDRYPPFRLGP